MCTQDILHYTCTHTQDATSLDRCPRAEEHNLPRCEDIQPRPVTLDNECPDCQSQHADDELNDQVQTARQQSAREVDEEANARAEREMQELLRRSREEWEVGVRAREDEELERLLASSKAEFEAGQVGTGDSDNDLQRILAESQAEFAARQQADEDEVLDRILRMSLEETKREDEVRERKAMEDAIMQSRREHLANHGGWVQREEGPKAAFGGAEGDDAEEEDDEDEDEEEEEKPLSAEELRAKRLASLGRK